MQELTCAAADSGASGMYVSGSRSAARKRRRRLRVPIRRRRMLESPVNRNPARPPRLPFDFFGARGVASQIEAVEILAGENIPIAVEKRALQIRRQRQQRLLIILDPRRKSDYRKTVRK